MVLKIWSCDKQNSRVDFNITWWWCYCGYGEEKISEGGGGGEDSPPGKAIMCKPRHHQRVSWKQVPLRCSREHLVRILDLPALGIQIHHSSHGKQIGLKPISYDHPTITKLIAHHKMKIFQIASKDLIWNWFWIHNQFL